MADSSIKIDYSAETEKLLAVKAAECIPGGIALCDWMRANACGAPGFAVASWDGSKLSPQCTGYFEEFLSSGKNQSIMVCRQDMTMGRLERPDAAEVLKDFVNGVMMNTGHWTYPDGLPGGFGEDWYFYHRNGVTSRVPDDQRIGHFDWRTIGREYDWALLNVRVYDFAIQFGPFARRVPSAVSVVAHPHFIRTFEYPSPGVKLHMEVGYSYADFAPFPNFLGYGPGKLGTAVKLYQFMLQEDNTVKSRLLFASSPRCRKVLDFGKWILDPVYDMADIMQKMTLGIFSSKPIHNMLDTQMIQLHGVVHQKYMDGVSAKLRAYAEARPLPAMRAGVVV